MLNIGDIAPEFRLMDADGGEVSLSDFRGRRVALFFYPKDNTPGCTRHSCAFASAFDELKSLGVEVIGISRDSVASHRRFADKNSLPFTLLSDPDLKAITAYGVWGEKKMCGKVSFGVVRTGFLISPEGVVEAVMPKVKPEENAQQILALVK